MRHSTLAAVTAAVLSAPILAQDPAPLSVPLFHFSERVNHPVDVTRIAVRLDASSPSATTLAGLRDLDLAIDPRLGDAYPGWILLRRVDGSTAPLDVREAIRRARALPGVTFATPVLRGAYGGPVIATPTLLVQFRDAVADTTAAPAAITAAITNATGGVDWDVTDHPWAGMDHAWRIRIDTDDGFAMFAAAARLAERDDVVFAEPDLIFEGRANGGTPPNDPRFAESWALDNVGQNGGRPCIDLRALSAWTVTRGSADVLVAVIDCGVQPDHPDLNVRTPGTDTSGDPRSSGNGSPVNAFDNHGTAVAGTISQIADNGLSTAGIAPDCRVASARAFIVQDLSGRWLTRTASTVDALAWAESIGARVTNNSNGYGFTASSIEAKYAQTRQDGMIHFAAAGNSGTRSVSYPARIPAVNAVSGIDETGSLVRFSSGGSNFGPEIAFTAPAIRVVTTDRTGSAGASPGDDVVVSGTSFSSSFAAGVAALVISAEPTRTGIEVEALLAATARDLGTPGPDEQFGAGLLDAGLAVGGPSQRPGFTLDGVGCPGAGSVVPSLSALGEAYIGNTGFGLQVDGANPSSLGGFCFTALRADTRFAADCVFHVTNPFTIEKFATDENGTASMPFPVPLDTQLIGAEVLVQALVQDPAGQLGRPLANFSGSVYATIRIGC